MAAQRFLVPPKSETAPSIGESEGDDEERDRVDRRQPLGRTALDQALARDLDEVDGEDGHHDGRLHRGCRPVVHRPGAELRAIETEA